MDRVSRVSPQTGTLSNFLRENPGTYSHYVLLDHQDWLAWNHPAALVEEWELILSNSRPGTKILMRSAGLDLEFIPQEVLERLRFDDERTTRLHRMDRVGTYGSTHFAEVIA
jgi:S-adenosylmethionine-diacylglycerol 3-amino-3-carboxypropyl transferase